MSGDAAAKGGRPVSAFASVLRIDPRRELTPDDQMEADYDRQSIDEVPPVRGRGVPTGRRQYEEPLDDLDDETYAEYQQRVAARRGIPLRRVVTDRELELPAPSATLRREQPRLAAREAEYRRELSPVHHLEAAPLRRRSLSPENYPPARSSAQLTGRTAQSNASRSFAFGDANAAPSGRLLATREVRDLDGSDDTSLRLAAQKERETMARRADARLLEPRARPPADLYEREAPLRAERDLFIQREAERPLRREQPAFPNPFVDNDAPAQPAAASAPRAAASRPVGRVVKKRERETVEDDELVVEERKRPRPAALDERHQRDAGPVELDDMDRDHVEANDVFTNRVRPAGRTIDLRGERLAENERELSRQGGHFVDDEELALRRRIAQERRLRAEFPDEEEVGLRRRVVQDVPEWSVRGEVYRDEIPRGRRADTQMVGRGLSPERIQPLGVTSQRRQALQESSRDGLPLRGPSGPLAFVDTRPITAFEVWNPEAAGKASVQRELQPAKRKIAEIVWDNEDDEVRKTTAGHVKGRQEAEAPAPKSDGLFGRWQADDSPISSPTREAPVQQPSRATTFAFSDIFNKKKTLSVPDGKGSAALESAETPKQGTVVSKEIITEDGASSQQEKGFSAQLEEAEPSQPRPVSPPEATTQVIHLPPALDSMPTGWRECIDRTTLQVYFLDHKRLRTTQENPWEAEVRATEEAGPTDPELVPILQECRDSPADTLAGALRTRLSSVGTASIAFRRLEAEDVRSILRAMVSIRQHYLFHDTVSRRQDFRIVPEIQVTSHDPVETRVSLTVRRVPFTEACRQRYSALRWTKELPSATSLQITEDTEVLEAAQQVCKQLPDQEAVKLWVVDRADLLDQAVRVVAEAGTLSRMDGSTFTLQFAPYKRCQTDPPIYEFEVSRMGEGEEEEVAAEAPPLAL